MQRIRPPPQRSLLLRGGALVEADSLSELGVYGVYVRANGAVLLNAEAGHLVRTKGADSDEGGVAAGFAVLDSPYLVDEGEEGDLAEAGGVLRAARAAMGCC
jgi:glutathione synthase